MSDRSLDKLALVSKIMLDERVVALRQENERLRLHLFWKDHSVSELKEMMMHANRTEPKCHCLACGVGGRLYPESRLLPPGSTCTFKPWFENIVAECGMTCVTGVGKEMEPVETHMSCGVRNWVYDADAHFHHLSRDDWMSWQYGAKLWKAESANDPEVLKLKRLFKALEVEIFGPSGAT